MDAVSDLQTAMVKVVFGKDEKGIQNVLDNVYPAGLVSNNKFLLLPLCKLPLQANLEKMLVSRGGQFFVGNNLSWADLAVFQFTSDGMGGKPPKVKLYETISLKSNIFCSQDLRAFPRIANLCERVGQVPNIKNWMNARPVTAM